MNRRTYPVDIKVNGHRVKTVIIDSHYELKHSATISDKLILELVQLLDGGDFAAESTTLSYEYYTTDNLLFRGKRYRMIWLIEKNELVIGVINAYRRR